MKKIISFMAILMLISPVVAAVPAGQSRRAMAQQMGAERATASRKYIETVAQINKPSVKYEDNNAKVPVADKNDDVTVVPPVQDDEDKKYYHVHLYNDDAVENGVGKIAKVIRCTVAEREKIELALISQPAVKYMSNLTDSICIDLMNIK